MTMLTVGRFNIPLLETGDGWLVVEKPDGMSVHNDPGHDLCSTVLAALGADARWAEKLAGDADFGVHAVHRLDRATSGVILLACRADTFRHFSRQFETRTATKRYVAVLHGRLGDRDTGKAWQQWTWPLARNAGGRKDPRGRGPAARCRTRIRPLGHTAHYTLAECALLTGRKHQIRRHAKLAGHPVVGDQRYGSPRSLQYLADHCGFARLGLHAMRLTVHLPENNRPRTFSARGVPVEIQRLLDSDHA